MTEKAVSGQDQCLESDTALPLCNFHGKVEQNFVHMLFALRSMNLYDVVCLIEGLGLFLARVQ